MNTEFIISICCLKATTESGVGAAAVFGEDEKNIFFDSFLLIIYFLQGMEDPIDTAQKVLTQSFRDVTDLFKTSKGDLSIFGELEEAVQQLPEYSGSLEEKTELLNKKVIPTIPSELLSLREQLKHLEEQRAVLQEKYKFITDDFILKN
jgi:hypothetical protein